MNHYRSSIPKSAQERILSTHPNSGLKQQVEYTHNGEVVGRRWFIDDGSMGSETPLKNGVSHGTMYYFDQNSDGELKVTFSEPYRDGLAHGTARQWSDDGQLIGTYTMKCGTGWGLWRCKSYTPGPAYVLHEARHIKDGNWHGFEWWFNEDQQTIHQEAHFWHNLQHGIRREWNTAGKLRRGFPQYWINNQRVTKRQYLRACKTDPSLPPFREVDNQPLRSFPPEIVAAIKHTENL